MRDNDCLSSAGHDDGTTDPARLAEQLAALAREARLLEFGLHGNSEDGSSIASDLERALEGAMDAESPDEVGLACAALEAVLGEILKRGMQLSAEMTEMEVDGVLGPLRMPVLTAVLTADA